MSQLTIEELTAQLASFGYTVVKPKQYTYSEINEIANKQGMYLLTNGNKEYYQDNKLHRTDGPAVEWVTGSKCYYQNGKLHRNDGPAIEYAGGDKLYYLDGKLHRTDGPAVEWADGYKAYYFNGRAHRTDGPAIEYASGTKEWYLDGKCHRTDGPAIERANGCKVYYLDGIRLSESEYIAKCAADTISTDKSVTLTIASEVISGVIVSDFDGYYVIRVKP